MARKVLMMTMLMALLSATILIEAAKMKVEKHVLYLHHTYNITAVRVAGPGGDKSKTQFGSIFVTDDVVREGASNSSTQLGRAKGIVAITSQDLSNAFYAFTIVLETSSYNATLSFQGSDVVGELAIVGGTQYFRLASGYAHYATILDDYPYHTALLNCIIILPTAIPGSSY